MKDRTHGSAVSRRRVLGGLGAAAGAIVLGDAPVAEATSAAPPTRAQTAGLGARALEAEQRRIDAAAFQASRPAPILATNGDEARFPDGAGSFTKTLPHNEYGEVDPGVFAAFVSAVNSGSATDINALPAGGTAKLANPRAAHSFSLFGADSHTLDMPAVHALGSARQAAEAAEVYWMALTRDVAFEDWADDAVIGEAATDLSTFSDFTGPRESGAVTPATLFRGPTAGDLTGPYVSQFLMLDVPEGRDARSQRARRPRTKQDFMTTTPEWLDVQRGVRPTDSPTFERRATWIANGRDLAEYVHSDYTFQAYLHAGLICLGFGPDALDESPYSAALREGAFLTFGPAAQLDLVAHAAVIGLRPAWFHKWLVHRKLRPEALGGRVMHQMSGTRDYGLDTELLDSPVLDRIMDAHGSHLLPQAYPEGSPTHPSYPAGHATIAGAAVTVLKALFKESFVLPRAVHANRNGNRLRQWTGEDLTLGGELDKLASNIATGRNIAGVHWRADGDDGLTVGEEAGISFLQDHLREVAEQGEYRLTRFDGTPIRVSVDSVTLA